jgi:hypothetical protein
MALKDLKDLFKPKWKSSRLYERLEATKEISKQNLLADIAKFDENENVRGAAVKNPNFTDQVLLAEIILNDKSDYVRRHAVKKLTDQALLGKIAKSSKDGKIRKIVLGRLKDRKLIYDIAINSKSKHIRKSAVEELEDQELVKNIAKNDKEEIVHTAAEKRLAYLQMPKAWEKHSKRSFKARLAALEELEDQKDLAWIAKNDPDLARRALEKLQDQEVLTEVLKKIDPLYKYEYDDPYAERTIYARKIDYKNIVTDDILSKVKDQKLLADLAKNANSNKIRLGAMILLDDSKWQDLLIDIFKNDEDFEVRNEAISQITDQDFLAETVRNEEIPVDLRATAVRRSITDIAIIDDIVQNHEDENIRQQARFQLEDLRRKKK